MGPDEPKAAAEQKPTKSGGYGKRPWWQWVLLYAVVAAVVYFVIYWIFFHHTGTTSGSLY